MARKLVLRKDRSTRGRIYVALAALLWSTIGIPTKIALSAGSGPAALGSFRSLIGALFSTIILRRKVLDKNVMILGILFTGPLFFTYMFSVMFSGMGIAAVLLYTAPALVVILARFFLNEEITKRKLIALLLAGIGAFLTQAPHLESPNLAGILFGFGAALSYSGVILMARKLMLSGYSALEVGLGPQPWSAIELLPFLFLDSYPLNIPFLLSVSYLGVFKSALAYILHAKGVKYVDAGTAGIIANLEPASAVILGILIGEQIGVEGLLGCLLVIGGAILAR